VELKSAVRFSKEVEGRLYTFTMPANAPVGEAYDILFEGLRKIVEISNKNVEKMVRQSEEAEVEVEPSIENMA
jgi:hypothetical protein